MILETMTKCETQINSASKEFDELVKLIDAILLPPEPSAAAVNTLMEVPMASPLESRVSHMLYSVSDLIEKIQFIKARIAL